MKVTVIGCGRWGSFISWYFSHHGHSVLIYGREGSETYINLKNSRRNEYLTLSDSVSFTSDLRQALDFSDFIVISVGTQSFPLLVDQIKDTIGGNGGKTFILCMKGIVENTGKRLTEVLCEVLGDDVNCVAWVGPGHAQDFLRGIPNCMLLVSKDGDLAQKLCKTFPLGLIRFYYSSDLIGCEVGAATKNIMGIAAGILDGMNASSLKGALMARGPREIGRLVAAMGGDERSVFGLSHIGDYEATLFSAHSHNRAFGESFVKGEKYDKLAEGVFTSRSIMTLKEFYNIDMPICTSVYDILYNSHNPQDEMNALFFREQKKEY